jgi:glutathione S-transferase
MPGVVVHGPSYSTYARTVRMVLLEKQVDHTLEPVDILAGEAKAGPHAARHPFGKVPSFDHDGFGLYETGAIVRYIDRAFPGPLLTPSDPKAAARMDQVLSIIDSYGYGAMIGQLAWQRLVVPMLGGQPDEAIVAAALPRVETSLSALEQVASGGAFLVGPTLTLADAYLAPVFAYLSGTPEAPGLLQPVPKLRQWWASISQRPSFRDTEPQFG